MGCTSDVPALLAFCLVRLYTASSTRGRQLDTPAASGERSPHEEDFLRHTVRAAPMWPMSVQYSTTRRGVKRLNSFSQYPTAAVFQTLTPSGTRMGRLTNAGNRFLSHGSVHAGEGVHLQHVCVRRHCFP
jgi:short subunit dehydrogenase-like uncharacterized protein